MILQELIRKGFLDKNLIIEQENFPKEILVDREKTVDCLKSFFSKSKQIEDIEKELQIHLSKVYKEVIKEIETIDNFISINDMKMEEYYLTINYSYLEKDSISILNNLFLNFLDQQTKIEEFIYDNEQKTLHIPFLEGFISFNFSYVNTGNIGNFIRKAKNKRNNKFMLEYLLSIC